LAHEKNKVESKFIEKFDRIYKDGPIVKYVSPNDWIRNGDTAR
jgi:hypothetical protein